MHQCIERQSDLFTKSCALFADAEGNPYMIFEFMEHGDLTELLRRNDPYQQHVTPPSRRGGQGQTLARQNNHSGRHGILLAKVW